MDFNTMINDYINSEVEKRLSEKTNNSNIQDLASLKKSIDDFMSKASVEDNNNLNCYFESKLIDNKYINKDDLCYSDILQLSDTQQSSIEENVIKNASYEAIYNNIDEDAVKYIVSDVLDNYSFEYLYNLLSDNVTNGKLNDIVVELINNDLALNDILPKLADYIKKEMLKALIQESDENTLLDMIDKDTKLDLFEHFKSNKKEYYEEYNKDELINDIKQLVELL